MIGIGLTDLPNIRGGGQWPPGPPVPASLHDIAKTFASLGLDFNSNLSNFINAFMTNKND